ncbi:MAG: hypothetical protein GTO22_27155 [Gemmatimonadales bacterium]|nr:hypothetical protein [Gemmatimonadales bacterium]
MPSTLTCHYNGPEGQLPQIAEMLKGRADSVLGQDRLDQVIQTVDGAAAGVHRIQLIFGDAIPAARVRAALRAFINMQGRSPNLNVSSLDGGVGDDSAAGNSRYALTGTVNHQAGEPLAHYA